MNVLPGDKTTKRFANYLEIALVLEVILLVVLLVMVSLNGKNKTSYTRNFFKEDVIPVEDASEEASSGGIEKIVTLHGEETRKTVPFSLEKGSYALSIKYSCNVADNYIVVMSDSLDKQGVFQDRWVKPNPKGSSEVIGFTLTSRVDDLYIGFISKGDSSFSIEELSVYSVDDLAALPMRITAVCVLWFLFCVILNILFFLIFKYPDRRKHYLLLFGAGLLMSLPLILPSSYLYTTNDLEFHVLRIYGIKDGLLRGIPWVKFQTNWYNGYGYMVSAFYGDMLLYIPALGNISGLSMGLSYRFFVVLINFLTLASSYYCFSGIFGRKTGFTGAITYSFLFYRFVDMFERGAVGEYCAIAFLPFLAYAVYALFKDDCFRSVILFVIGFTGVLNSHILTLEMAIIMLVMVFLFNIRRALVRKRLLALLSAAGAVLVVNLGFIVPFLDEAMHERVNVMDASRNTFSMNERGIKIYDVMKSHPGALPAIVLIFFTLFYLLYCFRRSGTDRRSAFFGRYARLIQYIFFTLISLWLCSSYFPWDFLTGLPGMQNIVSSIQFPWRFLAFAGLFSVLALGECLNDTTLSEKSRFKRYAGVSIALLFAIAGTGYSCLHYANTQEKVNYDSVLNLRPAWCSEHEYVLTGTDVFDTPYEYEATDGVSISEFEKDGDHIHFFYTSDKEGSVTLPLFNYNHYEVDLKNNSATLDLKTESGRNNHMMLSLPTATNGEVDIHFHYPLSWIASFVISQLSVAGAIGYVIYKKKKSISHTMDRGRDTSAT